MTGRSCSYAWVLAVLGLASLPAHAECDPADGAEFICGMAAPEDLIRVPDTNWVIVSAMAEGKSHLYAVDSRTRSPTSLYPTATVRERHDKKTYGSCPGPLPKDTFGAHGVDLRPTGRGKSVLYAVNHAGRESIEIFDLDATSATPVLTWIGCAVFPNGTSGNGVVGLSDGGFITTNFRDPADKDGYAKMGRHEITGNVMEWHPEAGWTVLPESAMSGANGVALTKDGKTLYVAGWPGKSVTRWERSGKSWTKKESIDTGILTDNLRWLADGSILAGGQDSKMPDVFQCRPPECRVGSGAVKIDPRTLKTTRVVTYKGNDSFEGATTVIEVGDEYWMGSYKGDRIARIKRSP